MKKSNISIAKEIVNAKRVGTRAKLVQLTQRRSYIYTRDLMMDRNLDRGLFMTSTADVNTIRGTITSSDSNWSYAPMISSTTSGSSYNNTVFTSTTSDMIKTSNMVLESDKRSVSSHDVVGTNEQVENVHEGDLVKTDGQRIFYIPSNSKKLYVIIIKSNKASLERTVTLENTVTDIYLTDSKVILVGSKGGNKDDSFYKIKTLSILPYLYDDKEQGFVEIRDKETMETVYKLETENRLSSHRLVADSFFVTTNKEAMDDEEKELRPIIYENGNKCFVPYTNIYYFNDTPQENITVLISIDVNEKRSSSIAFLGDFFKNIYMNEDSLYMVTMEANNSGERVSSRVIKFDVDYTKAELVYCATGLVDGTILDQYAMDEYKELFRVVTTFNGWFSTNEEKSRNRLFILKEDEANDTLKYVTSIEKGIGKRGETVKSARFAGDFVYITTFMKTDPIYTIDLTDIHYPIFKSEIKEDGYSTYMHEWGKDCLVGFGYSATPTGRVDGVKISAYKTDGTKNTPVDSVAFKYEDDNWSGWISNFQFINNPRSLLIYPEKNLLGFPIETRKYEYGALHSENIFMIMSVDFNRSNVLKKEVSVSHGESYIDRGLYIDGIVYTLSRDELVSYDLETNEIRDILSLRSKEMTRVKRF